MSSELDGLHPTAQRVATQLLAAGARGPFRQFEVPTKTARDAANALGCDVGAIASCLVFMADETPLIVLKSGAHRVDTEQLASSLGVRDLRQATPDEVRDVTGQAIGGVSPIGWPRAPRTVIDESLATFEEVWAACGTPNAVFRTTFDELRRLTNSSSLRLATTS